MEIVSSRSDEQVAIDDAQADFDFCLRCLAANLLRIIAGAGRSYELLRDMGQFAAALDRLAQLKPPQNVNFRIEQQLTSWQRDYFELCKQGDKMAEVKSAEDDIAQYSMRVIAARLLDQGVQETNNHSKLRDALRQYRKAWQDMGRC
jgi:hypothetical protein